MPRHRFVHIGDVHLQHGHPRNADRLAAFDQIIDETLCGPVTAYLIPGDLFHAKSTPEDRTALADRLHALAAHAPVVMVRGNHDAVGDLEIFTRLKANLGIYLATTPGVIRLATDDVAIACLPYPDKFGLVAAGVAPGDVVPTAAQLLDVIFMRLAAELEEARQHGLVPLFIGHANIRGAVASTGQPQIGLEQEIEVAMLERLPAVYWGLSHIHKAQEVGCGVYAGSIAAMDHGETEAKSYVVVDVEGGPRAWTAHWTRRPIDTPRMFHIDGRLTRQGFTVDSLDESHDEEIHRRLEAKDWAGCDVRVRYRYLVSEKPVLPPVSTIERLFAGALRLKVEGIADPDRDIRSPQVAAATTLAGKLAAYANTETLARSTLEKLALLEHDDQLLVRVAERLKAMESPERAARTVAA